MVMKYLKSYNPIETTTCHIDEIKEEIQRKKDPIPEDIQPVIDLTEEQLRRHTK